MCIIYLVRTQADLYIHQQKLSEIGAEGPPGPNVGGIWGNAFCPTRDTYIYDGFTALPKLLVYQVEEQLLYMHSQRELFILCLCYNYYVITIMHA